MKLRIFVYRLAAALTAFVFGISIFNVWKYFQTPEETVVVVKAVPPTKHEPLFVPPRIEPLSTVVDSKIAPKEDVEEEEETESEFSPDGEYYIIGDLPKGFKDFEYLSITTKNYENASSENSHKGVSIPPEGYFWTKKKFDFDEINIADKQISFETEAKKGISYKFVGEFIEEEEIPRKDNESFEYATLKGRLIKMRDGKKIAESKVKMGIIHGC